MNSLRYQRTLLSGKTAVALVLLLLLGFGIWTVFSVRNAKANLDEVLRLTEELDSRDMILTALRAEERDSSRELVSQIALKLEAARGNLRPFFPLISRTGWLPKIGERLHVLPLLLDTGQELSRGAESAIRGSRPLASLASEPDFHLLNGEKVDCGGPHQLDNWRGELRESPASSTAAVLPAIETWRSLASLIRAVLRELAIRAEVAVVKIG